MVVEETRFSCDVWSYARFKINGDHVSSVSDLWINNAVHPNIHTHMGLLIVEREVYIRLSICSSYQLWQRRKRC